MTRPLTYLAAPYSAKNADGTPNIELMELRFKAINKVAAQLMRQGLNIFSPISHCHPLAVDHELPRTWDFWEQYDRAYISCSNKLIVLKLDGWEKSTGVAAECKIAAELGIPIEYIERPI